MNFKNFFYIIFFYLFLLIQNSNAQLPGELGKMMESVIKSAKDLDANQKAGAGKSNERSELVKVFFESFENYAKALDLLTQVLGLTADNKKIKQALEDSKNLNRSESDRLANSVSVTVEVSQNVANKLQAGSLKLTEAESKKQYTEAISFISKGLDATYQLKTVGSKYLDNLSANLDKVDDKDFFGGSLKVMSKTMSQDLVPIANKIPEYVNTVVTLSRAVLNDRSLEDNSIETIDVKNAKSTLGKF
jgi:hypothetical protein